MGILPRHQRDGPLPPVLGRGRALDVILSGRDVLADEAARIGWLDALVPVAGIDDHTMDFARRIAAMPAASVAAVKRVVDQSLTGITGALIAETDAYGRLTSDGLHGADAPVPRRGRPDPGGRDGVRRASWPPCWMADGDAPCAPGSGQPRWRGRFSQRG